MTLSREDFFFLLPFVRPFSSLIYFQLSLLATVSLLHGSSSISFSLSEAARLAAVQICFFIFLFFSEQYLCCDDTFVIFFHA